MSYFIPIMFIVATVADGLLDNNVFGVSDGLDDLIDGFKHTIKYLKYNVKSDSAKEEIRNKMLDYLEDRQSEITGKIQSSDFYWQQHVACANIQSRLEENNLIDALELIEEDLEDLRNRAENGENLETRIEFYEDFYKGR